MEKDLRKGSWSAEEDQKLISYINRYGIWNWSQMPKFAGLSRSGKSCRLRWMNYLKPNVKKGKFSKEEDEIILHSHSLLGNRWSTIASKLPGRTDNDVKNYWHAHLKKRASERNLVFEKTKQNDTNSSAPTFEAESVEQIQDSADRMNDNFEFELSHEDESSSSHRITTFEDRQDEFRTCSIGTTDDLQCFWDQLCPVENLELRNNHVGVFSYDILHDSYNDGISSNDFYNNSILPDP